MTNAYSQACNRGYIYNTVNGRMHEDGKTWLNCFSQQRDGSGPRLYVGYDQQQKQWLFIEERD